MVVMISAKDSGIRHVYRRVLPDDLTVVHSSKAVSWPAVYPKVPRRVAKHTSLYVEKP
jgi:hypothetical protein